MDTPQYGCAVCQKDNTHTSATLGQQVNNFTMNVSLLFVGSTAGCQRP